MKLSDYIAKKYDNQSDDDFSEKSKKNSNIYLSKEDLTDCKGVCRNDLYLAMKEKKIQEELTYGKLEIIDISEFEKLKLDYSIIECLRDDNYKNQFTFDSVSGNYALKFEKVAHDKTDFYECVILKARSYIFEETEDIPIYENMLVYFFDNDEKFLELIIYGDMIDELVDELYYSASEQSDGSKSDDLSEGSSSNDDSLLSDDETDDILLEVTEDWVEKLFDERYNDPIILKNKLGEKMILKRIGRVDYRKKEYLVVKIFQKKFETKNIFIVYSVKYNTSGDVTSLDTVENKRLATKIKKIYAKKNKLKFSEFFKE